MLRITLAQIAGDLRADLVDRREQRRDVGRHGRRKRPDFLEALGLPEPAFERERPAHVHDHALDDVLVLRAVEVGRRRHDRRGLDDVDGRAVDAFETGLEVRNPALERELCVENVAARQGGNATPAVRDRASRTSRYPNSWAKVSLQRSRRPSRLVSA